MNLRQERLVSRCSKPGGDRLQCGSTRGSLQRQRHECRRRRRLPLSLLANPAVHHVRMQALGQSYTAYAGSRLGTAGQYLCLELLAVLTPPWAVLIQKLFHRLHDPPSWERCPIHELPSRWVRQPHTDEGGVEAFGIREPEHPSMKKERHCPAPPSTAITDSAQALREENERLRAEVAYLKKLQALIRSKRSAAPTKRV